VSGGVSNSAAARLAFVQQTTGSNQVVPVACSFSPSGGLSGTYTQTAPGPGVITHILVKASTMQQVYAVDGAPVSSGNWSTQCIRNNGGQQPAISGVFCFQVGTPPRQGVINITKKVVGGTGTFHFTLDNPAPAADDTFSLTPPANGDSTQGFVKPDGTYKITETLPLPAGFSLTSLVCERNGVVFQPTITDNGRSAEFTVSGDSVHCTYTNTKKVSDNGGPDDDDEVKRFVHRRVDNLLTYDPDRARMLRRLQRGAPQPSLKDEPLKLGHAELTGSGALAETDGETATPQQTLRPSALIDSVAGGLMPLASGQSSLKFGTSLSEIRAAVAMSEEYDMRSKMEAAGLGYFGQSFSNPYVELRQGFDVWVEGQIAQYEDTLGGIDRDGDFSILYLGADYVISPGFLVGALVQFDKTEEDIDDPSLIGEIDGTGWMAGPYFGVRLFDNLYFDARAAWGQSSNDFAFDDSIFGPRAGSFDTDRWLVSASLTGNHYYNAWRFSPQVKLAYGTEAYDAFASSLGQTIAGDDAHIGRLTGTMEVGRSFYGPHGTIIEPHAAISGIWNFDSDDLVINGQLVETDGARAKVEGGVLVTMPSGVSLRGAASFDGLGDDDLEAVSGEAWINIPLN
jgi:outer membrane autotransporter protein